MRIESYPSYQEKKKEDWEDVARNDPKIREWYAGISKEDKPKDVVEFMKNDPAYDYQKAVESGVRPSPQPDHGGQYRWDDMGKKFDYDGAPSEDQIDQLRSSMQNKTQYFENVDPSVREFVSGLEKGVEDRKEAYEAPRREAKKSRGWIWDIQTREDFKRARAAVEKIAEQNGLTSQEAFALLPGEKGEWEIPNIKGKSKFSKAMAKDNMEMQIQNYMFAKELKKKNQLVGELVDGVERKLAEPFNEGFWTAPTFNWRGGRMWDQYDTFQKVANLAGTLAGTYTVGRIAQGLLPAGITSQLSKIPGVGHMVKGVDKVGTMGRAGAAAKRIFKMSAGASGWNAIDSWLYGDDSDQVLANAAYGAVLGPAFMMIIPPSVSMVGKVVGKTAEFLGVDEGLRTIVDFVLRQPHYSKKVKKNVISAKADMMDTNRDLENIHGNIYNQMVGNETLSTAPVDTTPLWGNAVAAAGPNNLGAKGGEFKIAPTGTQLELNLADQVPLAKAVGDTEVKGSISSAKIPFTEKEGWSLYKQSARDLESYPDEPNLLAKRAKAEAILAMHGQGSMETAKQNVKYARTSWLENYGGRDGRNPEMGKAIEDAEKLIYGSETKVKARSNTPEEMKAVMDEFLAKEDADNALKMELLEAEQDMERIKITGLFSDAEVESKYNKRVANIRKKYSSPNEMVDSKEPAPIVDTAIKPKSKLTKEIVDIPLGQALVRIDGLADKAEGESLYQAQKYLGYTLEKLNKFINKNPDDVEWAIRRGLREELKRKTSREGLDESVNIAFKKMLIELGGEDKWLAQQKAKYTGSPEKMRLYFHDKAVEEMQKNRKSRIVQMRDDSQPDRNYLTPRERMRQAELEKANMDSDQFYYDKPSRGKAIPDKEVPIMRDMLKAFLDGNEIPIAQPSGKPVKEFKGKKTWSGVKDLPSLTEEEKNMTMEEFMKKYPAMFNRIKKASKG